jgi:hypothetical protein
MVVFQFYLQSGKQRKVGWVRDHSHVIFGKKISWWKMKCETERCNVATARSFVAKVRCEVFAHFQAFQAFSSSMQNWLFGLLGRLLCEQSTWCQRKLWVCSWLWSSPVSPFSYSMS